MEGVSQVLVDIGEDHHSLKRSATEDRQSSNPPKFSQPAQRTAGNNFTETKVDGHYQPKNFSSNSPRLGHPLLEQADHHEEVAGHNQPKKFGSNSPRSNHPLSEQADHLKDAADDGKSQSHMGRQFNKSKSFDYPLDSLPGKSGNTKSSGREQRQHILHNNTQGTVGGGSYSHEDQARLINEEYTTRKKTQGAHAVSQGAVKNILILGTAGAGKYTIAKNLSTVNERYTYTTTKRDKTRGIGQVQCMEIPPNKFVLIDTAGPQFDQRAIPNASSIKHQIEAYLTEGISLIIVVVRKDCGLPEEFSSLAAIIESLFSPEARNYIALVHSGCELLEEDHRQRYIETFKTASGPANKLSSLCKCGTIAVGFPDLDGCTNNYYELFQESIINSRESLQKLVKKFRYLQVHSDIFKKKLSDRMQLFQSSGGPDCNIM